MAIESAVATQLFLLCQQHPGVVWELSEASRPPHPGDVAFRDLDGVVVAYARAGAEDPAVDRAALVGSRSYRSLATLAGKA